MPVVTEVERILWLIEVDLFWRVATSLSTCLELRAYRFSSYSLKMVCNDRTNLDGYAKTRYRHECEDQHQVP